MAQDQQTIELTEDDWVQLTNADVTAITFQVLKHKAFIRFTTDATKPTEAHGILYEENDGELNKSISDLTSLTGADRVWAKPASPKVTLIYVDHA